MTPNELVLEHAHIPQVIASDWRKRAPRLDFDDLTGALNLALVKAAHAYDPTRGDFRAYAFLRCRGAAVDYLRDQDHLPRYVRQAIKRGDVDDAGTLARPLSLEACLDAGIEPTDLADFTTAADRAADRPRLRAALAALPERHRAVVIARYWHETPLADLAAALGVHPSRVSQLATEALHRMRATMGIA